MPARLPTLARRRSHAPGSQSRSRQFEPLEDRRLLALTVITADTSDSMPSWTYDMGTAIARRDGAFDTRDANEDTVYDAIQNTWVRRDGGHVLQGTEEVYPDLILYDWATHLPLPAFDIDEIAGPLTDLLHDRLQATSTGKLDLHFIGHGRGAYAHAEVLRRLAFDPFVSRIGFVQMTTLDPMANEGDGILDANPGDLVDFADNYYQDTTYPLSNQYHGHSVPGALNFLLNEQLSAWAGRDFDRSPSESDHHEVHDWYHWTIESEGTVEDPPPPLSSGVPLPTAAERVLLYDDYEADLNADGESDDFVGGARIGFYFTVAGGGIGNVVHRGEDAFTFDVAAGTTPLYLGDLVNTDTAIASLAYAPNGNLYYHDIFSKLWRVRIAFDSDNQPEAAATAIGQELGESFPFEIKFKSDGMLLRAEAEAFFEINPSNNGIGPIHRVPNWGFFQFVQTLAIDHNGDVYSVKSGPNNTSPKLVRVASDFNSWTELRALPYNDVVSLSVVGDTLYCFREAGSYFTIKLSNLELTEGGELDHPLLAGGQHIASLTSLTKPHWHNRVEREDITGDGRVTANDVLVIVNSILSKGVRTIGSSEPFTFYLDPNNDGRVSTSDLIIVVNHILNAQAEVDPLQQSALTAPAVLPSATDSNPQAPDSNPPAPVEAKSSRALNDLVFAAALQATEDGAGDEELDPWAVRTV